MQVSDIKNQETQQVEVLDSQVSDVVGAAEGPTNVETSPWFAPPPAGSAESAPVVGYPPQMGFNTGLVGAPAHVSDVDLTAPSTAMVDQVPQLASFPPASYNQVFGGADLAPDIAPPIPPTVSTPPTNL